MKLFSTFHYKTICLVFLLAPFQMVHPVERGNVCESRNNVKVEQVNEPAVAVENTTDILHGELLFRY